MALIINEYDKYSIRGKIIGINGDIFTIFVTSPFTCEIKFHCSSDHYDVLHPPISSKYTWISWVEDNRHPNISEASAYYNTEDKCFYKKESGRASKWEAIDFEDLYDDDPLLFTEDPNIKQKNEYWFFRDRYMPILQKEQLCHFSAYAIDKSNKDWSSVHNQEVDRHPGDYHYLWIYDPDSFYAEKWDAESIDDLVKKIRPSRDCLKQLLKAEKWDEASIDDLVKETRPSRDCLKQLLKSYEDDDWEDLKKKCKRIWATIKSTPKRVEDFLRRYRRLLWLIITLGMFLVGIGSFIVAYLTYSKG